MADKDKITAEDVPNILAFLSWNTPIDGAIPNDDEQEKIECGRMAILDACRYALEAKNVPPTPAAG